MEEKRADCFALFVFLVSRDCCLALPHDATGLSAVSNVVFPDHTHLLFLATLKFWLFANNDQNICLK